MDPYPCSPSKYLSICDPFLISALKGERPFVCYKALCLEILLLTPLLISQGSTSISYCSSLSSLTALLTPTISFFSSSFSLFIPASSPGLSSRCLVAVSCSPAAHAPSPVLGHMSLLLFKHVSVLQDGLATLFFFFPILANPLSFRLRDYILRGKFSLTSKTSKLLFLHFALAESTYLYHSSYTLIFSPIVCEISVKHTRI